MGVLDNLNYIKRVARHPCRTNPMIMVETAFEAALPLLFIPFTFSCTDWIKAPFGISWKCGRKLKTVAEHVYGPKFVKGAAIFYEVSGLALVEQLAWLWFLADVGSGFFADWMSLMYQENKCEMPGAGYIQTTIANFLLFPGGEKALLTGTMEAKPCGYFTPDGVFILPGCTGAVSFHVRWSFYNPGVFGEGAITTWIDLGDGKRYSECTYDPSNPQHRDGWTGSFVNVTGHTVLGTVVRFRGECSGGIGVPNDGEASATLTGRPIPLIAPGCFSPHDYRGSLGSIQNVPDHPLPHPPPHPH